MTTMVSTDGKPAITHHKVHEARDLVTRITPKTAQQMLEERGHNRNIRPSAVDRYASDMAEGRWHDFSVIRIDRKTGLLLDGQHRLAACIKANTPIKVIVLKVDSGDILTTDIGATRRLSDMIRFDRPEETNLSAIASIVVAHADWDGTEFRATKAVSVPELAERYRANVDLYHEAATKTGAIYRFLKGKGFPASHAMLGLAYILIKERADDPSWVDTFLEEWVSEDYTGHDVFGVLNQALNSRGKDLPSINVYAGRRRFLAIVLKGWNAWVQGETPQRIVFHTGGPTKTRESFPHIAKGDRLG